MKRNKGTISQFFGVVGREYGPLIRLYVSLFAILIPTILITNGIIWFFKITDKDTIGSIVITVLAIVVVIFAIVSRYMEVKKYAKDNNCSIEEAYRSTATPDYDDF